MAKGGGNTTILLVGLLGVGAWLWSRQPSAAALAQRRALQAQRPRETWEVAIEAAPTIIEQAGRIWDAITGLSNDGSQPIDYWMNTDTLELRYQPGVNPPGSVPPWRPASEWEVQTYG